MPKFSETCSSRGNRIDPDISSLKKMASGPCIARNTSVFEVCYRKCRNIWRNEMKWNEIWNEMKWNLWNLFQLKYFERPCKGRTSVIRKTIDHGPIKYCSGSRVGETSWYKFCPEMSVFLKFLRIDNSDGSGGFLSSEWLSRSKSKYWGRINDRAVTVSHFIPFLNKQT